MKLVFGAILVAIAVCAVIWKVMRTKVHWFLAIAVLTLLGAAFYDLTANAGGRSGLKATMVVAFALAIPAIIFAVTQGFISLGASPAIPKAFIWFLATAVLFALQAFPYTGIFLMFLLAPFWSIVTINLGFLHFAVDAYGGKISRAWLVLPVVWFGGYLALAMLSHFTLRSVDRDFRTTNEGRYFSFDRNRHNLVFPENAEIFGGAASHFVQSYDVDVAYQANRNIKSATHLAYRIGARATCDRIRGDSSYQQANVHSFGMHENSKFLNDLCLIHMPEDPALAKVSISAVVSKASNFLVAYQRYDISISDGMAPPVKVVAGHGTTFSWLPMPVIGCSLNSARASWPCTAEFWRTPVALGGSGTYGAAGLEVVAKALRLTPAPVSSRRAAIEQTSPPAIDTVVKGNVSASMATLKSVITQPIRHISVHDVKGLIERPDLIAEHAPAISSAIIRAIDAGPNTFETARVLQNLLVPQPNEVFAPPARAVMEHIAHSAEVSENMLAKSFTARLSIFGADALPVFKQLAFRHKRLSNAGALIGFCRVGLAAKPLADDIFAVLTATKRTDEQHAAAYIALLRLGRSDLAVLDPDAARSYRQDQYRTWLQTISPDSSPKACIPDRLWPIIPE